MRFSKLFSIAFAAVILSACAHPYSVSPSADKLGPPIQGQQINASVAYIITPEQSSLAVTTPGGGGDKVTYQPYRDIETGFYRVLSNVFTKVTRLKSATDTETMAKNNISMIITPTIKTDSSSPSALTWPPTRFTTELTCKVTDKNGQLIFETKVSGNGAAEFDEFKKDFNLTGRRASEDVLLKLQRSLSESPELKSYIAR